MKQVLLLFFLLIFNHGFTQNDSIWQKKPKLNVEGFLDVYYVYDFNEPKTNYRKTFLYNHNRHNEFNLNLGYLKLNLDHQKYRANLAFQAGTYVQDNYINEPEGLKSIFEANIGVSLNKNNNLWLDAGVFGSHIGFESAISSDNWNLTRSLLAENSPYYLSGIKLSYQTKNNWEFNGLIINGWQRIQRLSGNSMPSFGTQVKYVKSDHLTFNWSTFIGTDQPDSIRKMRYFNNLYAQFQVNKRLGIITGFDIGYEQKAKHSKNYNFWYSPVVIAQYKINKKWKTAVRLELYQDENKVIINQPLNSSFYAESASLNFDYQITDFIVYRIEARYLEVKNSTILTKYNFFDHLFIGNSLSIKLKS